MFGFLSKLLDSNEKEVKKYRQIVDTITALETTTHKLKDKEFAGHTAELKVLLSGGQTLDEVLPRAYALVREAAQRSIGQRHFDVQLIASIALHKGKVAEQKNRRRKNAFCDSCVVSQRPHRTRCASRHGK